MGMKNKVAYLMALIVLLTAGCVSRSQATARALAPYLTKGTPPAANDWTTEYEGSGSVRTSITNASHRPLFLKVRQGRVVAAQVRLFDNGTRDVNLAPGAYSTVMKLGTNSYYRGPTFSVPSNTAHMMLRLQASQSSNLVPTTQDDFEQ